MPLLPRRLSQGNGSLTVEPARSSDINHMVIDAVRRSAAKRPAPVRNRLGFITAKIVLLLSWLAFGSCGFRTLPPIKYVPLLGAEKNIATSEVLVRALKDRDVVVRAQAVELLELLSQSDRDNVKKKVAKVFGDALKDHDPGIRLQVIEKLGKMEAKYGYKYLLAAVQDPNPFVREKVLSVLTNREEDRLAKEAARLAAETTPLPSP